MITNNLPNPGSKEAINQGCTCPVIDNCYGKGIGQNGEKFGWYMSADCSIHGNKLTNDSKKEKGE